MRPDFPAAGRPATPSKQSPALLHVVRIASIVPVASLIWLITYLAGIASRGLDVTDESFYLMLAADPGSVIASVTAFGFYTGVLFDLAGRDIAGFRIAGVFALSAVGFLAGASALVCVRDALRVPMPPTVFAASSAMFTLACLGYYSTTVLTPGYNWLNLIGLLIALMGLALSCRVGRIAPPGAVLAGVGVGLSFMAKFPSAGAYALVVASVMSLWPGPSLRSRVLHLGLLAGGVTAVFLLHVSWFQDVPDFVAVFERGQRAAAELRSHDIGALLRDYVDSFGVLARQVWNQYQLGFIVAPVAFAWAASSLRRRSDGPLRLAWALVCFSVFMIALAWWRGSLAAGVGADRMILAAVLAMTVMLSLIAAAVLRVDGGESGRRTKSDRVRTLLLVFALLSVPAAYAFGTGNSPAVLHARRAVGPLCLVWFIALLVLLARYRAVAVTVLPLAAMSVALAYRGMTIEERPYRLAAPFEEQVERVELGDPRSTLKLDAGTARAWIILQDALGEAGFRSGRPIIDFTGVSPGLVFGVGGQYVGAPWLPGGYPGSPDLARFILDGVPRTQIVNAWLITAPNAEHAIDPGEILAGFGVRFPRDYNRVVRMRWPQRKLIIEVWRPGVQADASRQMEHE